MAGTQSHRFSGLLLVLCAALTVGCPPRRTTPRPVGPPPVVVGPAFSPPGQGQPFARFIANRDFMHRYLYNGDDLFPKAVNLCSRGRNALLDLDRGPGASYDLGLFGPAWEAHLYAVAVDRDPRHPFRRAGRTRFVFSWPVVTTSLLHMLRTAHAVSAAASDTARTGTAFWRQRRNDLGRLRFADYLRLRHPRLRAAWTRLRRKRPPTALRKAARDWCRRLQLALLERLAYSVRYLRPSAPELPDDAGLRRLTRQLLEAGPAASAALSRFQRALTQAARAAGLLVDTHRYRGFHERTLLSSLGPSWRYGRVTSDQLRAILGHIQREQVRFDATFGPGAFRRAARRAPPALPPERLRRWREGAALSRLHPRVLRELARVEYVLRGHKHAQLPTAQQRHGAGRLERDRQAYVRLAAEIKQLRKRLTELAKRSLTAAVRQRMHRLLVAGEPSLAVGAFYFETEHLLETTSGFTHVGLVKRLPDPQTKRPLLWVFDRVLGFHYAYPVVKLTNSVPVQAIALSPRVRAPRRRYRWLALTVPSVFQVGGGRISTHVSLVNLFAHVRQLLRRCPALTTRPGFYYAGVSWLINHPANKRVLRPAWRARAHTGYHYVTLDAGRLQRLRGQRLFVPVLQVDGAPWTTACPARRPTPKKGTDYRP